MFLLLGLSKWLWATITTNQQLPLIGEHYRISGKRMILGAFVLYTVHRLSPKWTLSPRMVQTGTLMLCLMLILITLTGIHGFMVTGERPKINSDAATSGAYMFTLLALVTLWSIRKAFPRHYPLPFFLILFVSFILLGVSETRSAILLFSLFCLVAIIHHIMVSPWRTRVMWISLFAALLIAATFSAAKYSSHLLNRIETVKTEIEQYQNGDTSTSIGGRIGMWQAGLWAFTQHPWGQSADSRNQEAKHWLDIHQPDNQIAYLNIQYHTHNDIIESLSLQGIAGGITMIAFFVALLVSPLCGKKRYYEGLLLAIPVIYFSMGDSQFYNRESPYFILLIWGYFVMMRQYSASVTSAGLKYCHGKFI
ncbi:MAG: O-antigen ligase family protein [Enterobacterales bacterium endosymbiont of Blomia tropicalis]|uniref:O-antigen ligase family protein n=1 Tax=Mixta mediterraneensis TaxID=2758443 RepID=UPI0025A82EF5|nr:O-antigen ligase family protein [Mixta mediterraneensis]MDL4913115.1 O-antigen ligase family protein [Mixta mediterraneensis]